MATVFATVSTPGPPGPPGPQGPPGRSPVWIVAPGAPASGTGQNGDMYLNNSTGDVYGPKAGGAWGPIVANIKGPTGPAGYSPQYIVAAGPPSPALGQVGDMYINSSTSDIYGPKSAGGWGGIVCNIKGATGAQGPPGTAYTPRGAWSAAVTYAQGDEVTYSSNLYISLQSSNLNNVPSSSPTWWQGLGSGVSQTPWLSNIDGAGFNLGNVGHVGIGIAAPSVAALDARTPAATYTQIHFCNSPSADNGGYLSSPSANAVALGAGIGSNAASGWVAKATSWTMISQSGSTINFYAQPTDTIGAVATFPTPTLAVTGPNVVAQGNVGIGKTPAVSLDVNGQIRSMSGTIDLRLFAGGGGGALIGSFSNDSLLFYVNSAEWMRISPTGYVGIGIGNASAKLNVSGASGDPNLGANCGILNLDASTGVQLSIGINTSSPYGAWLQAKVVSNNGGVYPLNLQPLGGQVSIGAATSSLGCLLDVNLVGGIGAQTHMVRWGCNASGVTFGLLTEDPVSYLSGAVSLYFNGNPSTFISAAQNSYVVMPGGANFGVGHNGPQAKLHVYGAGTYNAGFQNSGQLFVQSSGFPGAYAGLVIGYDTALGPNGMGFLQAGKSGTGYLPLLVNPNGGAVGVFKINPFYQLDVTGDINCSGAFRVNGTPISTGGGGITSQTKPARTVGTVFQNTTGKSMLVQISVGLAANIGAFFATDSSASPTTETARVVSATGGDTLFLSSWVLPGNYYKLTAINGPSAPAIADWVECT